MPCRRTLLLAAALVAGGCSSPRSEQPASDNPYVAHALPASQRSVREGEVIERVPAGPYVYLRLRERSGRSSWLVSLRATTPSADHVRAWIVGQADHFHSRRLSREFSPLAFAAVRGAAP